MRSILFLASLSLALLPPLVYASEEQISFYEIPLSCHSAKSLGCGSHSKPVLLAMENDIHVREAWLNRPGTVIAVIWEQDKTSAVVKEILSRFDLSFHELTGEPDRHARESFNLRKDWYKGAEVNQLSVAEAAKSKTNWVWPIWLNSPLHLGQKSSAY